jgi:hypothetical protein
MTTYGEWRYRSSFLTSALDGGGGQLHASAALPPGKEPRYLLHKRLGGLQSRSERCAEENNFSPAGIRAPAVHPVAHRYTDWAILPRVLPKIYVKTSI